MLQSATQGKTYLLLAGLALTFGSVLVAAPASADPGDGSRTTAAPPPAPTAAAPPPLPFKLPPGTRRLAEETASPAALRYTTSTGLAEATRFLERQLARAGIACERIGPYRVRGVEVTRFISQQASTPWLAIHLIRKEGRTSLDVVARPVAAPTISRAIAR